FRPPVATRLQGKKLFGIVVNANKDLGTVQLNSGVLLSGHTQDSLGQPVQSVDLDLFIAGTPTEIFVAWDRTNEFGDYAVIVPTGLFDIHFIPPRYLPIARKIFTNFSISGDTVLNVVFSECAAISHYGTGTPGSGGYIPQFDATGTPRLGNTDFAFDITQALGSTSGFIFLSLAPASIPGNGWTLLVSPSVGFTVIGVPIFGPPVPGQGYLHLPASIPDDTAFAGITLYMQCAILDTGAPGPLSASDGLQLPLCP
ncbi:MAG: hypothetical protein AB1486_35510, partial [Planctomycetota bacterium]